MNLTRSSLSVYFTYLSSSAFGFLAIVIFANELGASVMGSFFLFQAAGGLLRLLTDFGFSAAVQKRISETEGQNPELISAGLIVKVVLFSISTILILVFSGMINSYIGANLSVMLVLSVLFQEIAMFMTNVLRGELRVAESELIWTSRRPVWLVVGSALVFHGWGIQGIVVGYISGFIFSSIIGTIFVSSSLGKPTLEHFHSLLSFAKYESISDVSSYSYNWIDVAILGIFVTQFDVGIYEYAWQATLPLLLLSRAISISIFPQISDWNSKKEIEKIENAVTNALRVVLFVLIPAVSGAIVLSDEVFQYVFGQPSTIGPIVLIILSAEKIIQSMTGLFRRVLSGLDEPYYTARVAILIVFLNVALNVLLITQYGVIGAALSLLVSLSVGLYYYYKYLTKFINIEFPTSTLVWSIFSSVVMMVSLLLISNTFPGGGILYLLTLVTLGALIYTFVSISIPELRMIIFTFLEEIFEHELVSKI